MRFANHYKSVYDYFLMREIKSHQSEHTEPKQGHAMNQTAAQEALIITAADLPLYCTGETEGAWNGHPKVFLPIKSHSSIACPYCGTVYHLNGEAGGHH